MIAWAIVLFLYSASLWIALRCVIDFVIAVHALGTLVKEEDADER